MDSYEKFPFNSWYSQCLFSFVWTSESKHRKKSWGMRLIDREKKDETWWVSKYGVCGYWHITVPPATGNQAQLKCREYTFRDQSVTEMFSFYSWCSDVYKQPFWKCSKPSVLWTSPWCLTGVYGWSCFQFLVFICYWFAFMFYTFYVPIVVFIFFYRSLQYESPLWG